MGESNTHAGNKESTVQCIELLVSKISLERSGNNLLSTLSVYSLENRPLQKKFAADGCEGFHFMVYDWNRTIKRLLDDFKIPYTVTQYFSLDSFTRDPKPKIYFSEADTDILIRLNKMLGDAADWGRSLSDRSADERTDLILDDRNA